MTYCTASEENIGRGRCNHIAHQKNVENISEFLSRANQTIKETEPKFADGSVLPEKKRYGSDPEMDKLVDCEVWWDCRKAVEQGYGLDKLINDKEWEVRKTVADKARGCMC